MTLVVAKKSGAQYVIVADTRADPALQRKWTLGDQVLKFYCPSESIVIAYAGNLSRIAIALQEVSKLQSKTYETVCAVLRSVNADSLLDESEAEFLVLPASASELTKISEGKLIKATNAYLGSQSAFSHFQKFYNAPPGTPNPLHGGNGLDLRKPPGPEVSYDFQRKMENRLAITISANDFPNVGGIPTTLVRYDGKFAFVPRGSMFHDPSIHPRTGRDPMHGDARYGDFNYGYVPPEKVSDNLHAILFPLIRKCLILKPSLEHAIVPEIIEDVSWDTLQAEVKRRYGVVLKELQLRGMYPYYEIL